MERIETRIDDPTKTHRPFGPQRWAILLVAGAVLIAVLVPPVETAYWIGDRTRTLVFSVDDSESGDPLTGAEITIFKGPSELPLGAPPPVPDPADPKTEHFSTAEGGKANVSCRFVAYGHRSRFTDWGRVRFSDRHVRVTAAGYASTQFSLGDRIGNERDIHDGSLIELSVEMTPSHKNDTERVD